VALRAQGGLEAFLWSFRPAMTPAPTDTGEMTTTSPESLALSKALKKAGFAFVGPTTMHALMAAIGLVDDHLVGCHAGGS
jgi:DNA-3-methyladenine glycosylase I